MSESHDPDPLAEPASVLVLRDIAQAMAAVRASLEHGDRSGAVHAAQHLVRAVERLPATREEYERMCEEADRLLAADPAAWDRPPAD